MFGIFSTRWFSGSNRGDPTQHLSLSKVWDRDSIAKRLGSSFQLCNQKAVLLSLFRRYATLARLWEPSDWIKVPPINSFSTFVTRAMRCPLITFSTSFNPFSVRLFTLKINLYFRYKKQIHLHDFFTRKYIRFGRTSSIIWRVQ